MNPLYDDFSKKKLLAGTIAHLPLNFLFLRQKEIGESRLLEKTVCVQNYQTKMYETHSYCRVISKTIDWGKFNDKNKQ